MQTNEIILSMFNIVALTVFLQEIDESHLCSTFKYIKNKPVKELKGDQFLRMCKAEEDGLLIINIEIDLDKNAGYPTNYFDWQSGFLYLSFSRSSCFFFVTSDTKPILMKWSSCITGWVCLFVCFFIWNTWALPLEESEFFMGTRKYFCPIKKYIPLKDLSFNCFLIAN